MATSLIEPPVAAGKLETKLSSQDGIRDRVQLALFSARAPRSFGERRRVHRYPYPYPVYLTPLARDGAACTEETIVVVGKHLSECGLDFYYHQPMPHRKMIASFEYGDDHWVGLVLQLTWCRFSRHGWYDNGGRFLQVADSPLEDPSKIVATFT